MGRNAELNVPASPNHPSLQYTWFGSWTEQCLLRAFLLFFIFLTDDNGNQLERRNDITSESDTTSTHLADAEHVHVHTLQRFS